MPIEYRLPWVLRHPLFRDLIPPGLCELQNSMANTYILQNLRIGEVHVQRECTQSAVRREIFASL